MAPEAEPVLLDPASRADMSDEDRRRVPKRVIECAPLKSTSWGDYERKQLLSDCKLHGVAYSFG